MTCEITPEEAARSVATPLEPADIRADGWRKCRLWVTWGDLPSDGPQLTPLQVKELKPDPYSTAYGDLVAAVTEMGGESATWLADAVQAGYLPTYSCVETMLEGLFVYFRDLGRERGRVGRSWVGGLRRIAEMAMQHADALEALSPVEDQPPHH